VEKLRLDAERLIAGEHFARDLEQYPFEGGFSHSATSIGVAEPNPAAPARG
jgi:hypothetical protein